MKNFQEVLGNAITARKILFDEKHQSAFRLFNGFLEGNPEIAIDLYGRTVVIHNYADSPAEGEKLVEQAKEFLLSEFGWLRAIIVKTRKEATANYLNGFARRATARRSNLPNDKTASSQQHAPRGISLEEAKNGVLIHGERADDRIREHGVWYALELLMNRDASLYLDTCNLRKWAIDNLHGKRVLNTFAYTGSLGVAAQAGGAERVVQTDLSRKFLNLGKTSYTLNGFPIHKKDFQTGDFWSYINRLKRAEERFDCVFLDPPFFASTNKGRVDLSKNSVRLINKVRPLIEDGGQLVAINNALFVSGTEYLSTLEKLCKDGYLEIERLIPVPDDFTGYPNTRVGTPHIDPAPFNHSTKIAVLKVQRKA